MKKQRLQQWKSWILIAVCLGFIANPVLAGPSIAIVGDWQAVLDTGKSSMHVVVHVSQGETGQLSGTLDSPDQGVTGIEITTIRFSRPDLHFELQRIGSSFDGKINGDNSQIAGDWKQGSGSLPLTFKRVSKDVASQHDAQPAALSAAKAQVLEQWATALGGRETLQNVRILHLRGKVTTAGMNGTYERWTTSRGKFRMEAEIPGVFRQVTVYDGHNGWTMDRSGTVQTLSGPTLKGVTSSAYEATMSYLFPERLPGLITLLSADAKSNTYSVRLDPEGGNAVTVFIDNKSYLPVREETIGRTGNTVISFSDWHNFAGIKLPGTVRQSNGDPTFDVVLETEQAEINIAPGVADLFARPAETANPANFIDGTHQAVIPATVYAQHVFLPVRVNGSEAVWLFVDSGAEQSFISRSLAEKIGLTIVGSLAAKGTGAGATSMASSRNVVFSLPGVDVPMKAISVWDFSSILPMLGRPWDGTLGYDVLSRLVVTIDYEHREVTLHDPATFVASGLGTALPITFLGNVPIVRASIVLPGKSPIDVDCVIDSGAGGFHLSTPFAEAHGALQSFPATISASTIGAGGPTTQSAGRMTSLQLGPYRLHGPIVTISPGLKEGLLASRAIGALIGGSILQRFTVTFDYPHQRMFLKPNSQFAKAFHGNQSGLSLVARGTNFRHFEVDGVETGSPAEVAGIRVGDIVTRIDGVRAEEFDLDKIDQLMQRVGRNIQLKLTRNGEPIKVAVKLGQRI